MQVDEVIARLEASGPAALAGRVRGALDLSALVAQGSLPQVTPAAFVLPLGLRGGDADAAAGLFRQTVFETVSVVVVLRATGSPTGAAALASLESLVDGIVAALAGWGPVAAPGVFQLARGDLVSLSAGAAVYQLDFALQDQLRIAT